MVRVALHIVVILVLTVLTQLGGLAWVLALAVRRRLLAFVLIYAALSVAAGGLAPFAGRVALPCFGDGALRVASPVFCAMNRHYAAPDMADLLTDLSQEMAPDAQVLILDANFPLFDGFPLLPHLSHDNGDKVDLAFWYRDESGPRPGLLRSPIGYFAFEDGPTDCAERWPTLRWDMTALQPLWRDLALDSDTTGRALRWLLDDPRTGKIFLEPHLQTQMGLSHPKLRFQGCRAARHDDHIHLEL